VKDRLLVVAASGEMLEGARIFHTKLRAMNAEPRGREVQGQAMTHLLPVRPPRLMRSIRRQKKGVSSDTPLELGAVRRMKRLFLQCVNAGSKVPKNIPGTIDCTQTPQVSLNRGGKGMRSPADGLVQGLSSSQLSWNYAGLYSPLTLRCG